MFGYTSGCIDRVDYDIKCKNLSKAKNIEKLAKSKKSDFAISFEIDFFISKA